MSNKFLPNYVFVIVAVIYLPLLGFTILFTLFFYIYYLLDKLLKLVILIVTF